MNYYNEWDKGAAAWLRELIKAGLIPNGYVDERSITDVTPSDLEGFTQCHFFAGIAGWSLALQLAGVPASTRLWTGSPPCQPFSVAGQSLGFDDQRHLAPAFLRLIRECKPELLFGEQVAAAIGKNWLDFVFLNLEDKGYTCGAAVLPACSVGAPHKRDRLFFGATLKLADTGRERIRVRTGESIGAQGETESGEEKRERIWADAGAECANLSERMADTNSEQRDGRRDVGQRGGLESSNVGIGSSMADTYDARSQGRVGVPERADQQPVRASGMAGELANSEHAGYSRQAAASSEPGGYQSHLLLPDGGHIAPEESGSANPDHSFWSDADWLGCRDGKFRPVESGTFPLANGVPARVGRLRGYGNAIVPQVAAEFIRAFMIN